MTASCQPDLPPRHPTGTPNALYLLLALVAGAAGMLSFAALRDLAELCGFAPRLAWLLPVVVDAGAAAGSLGWLAPTTSATARVFARRLALGLLGLSVAANALGHGLAAYQLAPPWWVVVALSGIAPAVLGAMVHLAVLVGRPPEYVAGSVSRNVAEDEAVTQESDDQEPDGLAAAGRVGGFPWTWITAPGPPPWPSASCLPGDSTAVEPLTLPTGNTGPANDASLAEGKRVAALIAAGAGRRRLSRELGVSEHEARRLLDHARTTTSTTAPVAETPTQSSPSPATADAVLPASSGALS